MNDNEKSFLDGNTLLAIGLSILFFVGWQFYMQKKYPKMAENQAQLEKTSEQPETAAAKAVVSENQAVETKAEKVSAPEKEFLVSFEGKNLKLHLSSLGMGLKEIQLAQFSDRDGQTIRFAKGETSEEGTSLPAPAIGNFATLYEGKPISFEIKKISDKEYLGQGVFSQGRIEKRITFDEERYFATTSVKVYWQGDASKPIETYIVDQAIQSEESSLFVPSYEGSRFFALSEGSEEREMVDPGQSASYEYEKVSLVAVDTQYFSLSLLDQSPIIPRVKMNYNSVSKHAEARIYYSAVNTQSPMEIQSTIFMGPKQYDLLVSIDEEMSRLIDYGFFSILSKPILSLLKGIYGVIHNWGLAIILLTICIRLLLLPINISSYKSMQKMQKIQPLLKQIKEKYKNDPQRINQETMLIMKREKANPLGGCLPMLMQIPVFFALFTVLGQSIELYKSPFAFWIQDLSYKDPFFVMPVVVGALYFLQMQLTPTSAAMDPTQAKIMKFIPLIFVFFMFSMPSGLTLYFAVNTIFGIGQQYILQKEKRKAAA